MEKTITKRNVLNHIKRKIKLKFFKISTQKSMDIFLRGQDIISIAPQVDGMHEEVLTKIIDNFANNGGADFLIDIGANIGLTSCQNGSKFKKVICFEPNPLAMNILKTNLAISLINGNFEVFQFALGERDGAFELHIPIHNWGGAFVMNGNDYSEATLSKKDGFNKYEVDNYLVRKVDVKNAETVLSKLFSDLLLKGLCKGVVKIDVEGFERKILLAIATCLPKAVDLMIVFENWDEQFNLTEIQEAFSNRHVEVKKIISSSNSTSKFENLFKTVFFGRRTFIGDYIENENIIGDIILHIK